MAHLLVAHHSPSPPTHQLLEAVLSGLSRPELATVHVEVLPALAVTASHVLEADGYVLGTTANFGYMSGALKHMFDTTEPSLWNLNWWSDTAMFGHYPAEGLKAVESMMPAGFEKDMEIIHQPYDYFGLNCYWGDEVSAGADGKVEFVPRYSGHPITAFHWPVTPDALYWGPKFLYERYKLPVLITENGLSNSDWVSLDGKVHDLQRIDHMSRYLGAFSRAYQDGVEVAGYLHWSIMDNFEWAEGMKHRFGLIHVDYRDGKRTLKDSAHWYKEVIRSNGESLP